MVKVKKSKPSKWKPLKLEGSFFSEGVEGLIGIEELTEYNLEKRNRKRKVTNSDVKLEKVNVLLNNKDKRVVVTDFFFLVLLMEC